ncbi:MAG: type II toxin-antitoxin system prevent-host-death family antitoxin [Rhizobiales bacterium]|nr:type II toxin-antitoxin system prevent-host-death family antitoxin [Hyphomicrobiales bacterium]MDQ3559023.1 type II toxin-antitoxin system prevent-host-death family antitoxin [Pseudomonadota bacterium]
MNTIQLRDAKAHFSALVEAAEKGEATTITKHGRPAAMLIPMEDAKRIYAESKPSLVKYLMTMPADIPIRRNRSRSRKVEL